ncbi:MAG TPA: L-lactate dehydrogenase [Rhizomicrobium sp.]|jgi:L-lactate dehydrogenase (cytochrome)|nr:L-lactate dehydrogenase [Rhizomicrobium sp.]
MKIVNFEGFRSAAQKRLPRFLFEYIDGGSYDEHTLRRNVRDFKAVTLRQRVLRDVSNIRTATRLFGRDMAMPVALAPVGIAGFFRRRGEIQAIRAAESAGVPMVLSTMSCCTVEEVRAASKQPFWMQLYMIRDRGFMKDLLGRVEASGTDTLFLTVDLAINGIRYRDRIGGLAGSQSLVARPDRLFDILFHPAWALDVGLLGRPHIIGNVAPAMPSGAGLQRFQAWVARNFDPSVTYKDISWLRDHWKGKLVLKGVTDPGDAKRAADEGMDGIVVSNHGGRQLDGSLSSIAALAAVREAVAGRMTVMLDGGVRSGLDVLRALALGADGVLLGRAWAWALAARGEAGVAAMLAIVKEELEVAMALTGQSDVRALDSDLAISRP